MIIGILGKKRNGKDTIADYLVKNYGFIKMAFADPIKEASRILFDFNDDQLYGDLKETIDPNWKVSPRTVLQYIGTEVFRKDIVKIMPHIGENFWTTCVQTKYLNLLKKNPNIKIVVSDVRFQNEVDMILSLGGSVYKVERPSINTIDTHESEKQVDTIKNYTALIINGDTLDTLYRLVDSIVCLKSIQKIN
jgi:hypothetical protein